MEFYGMVELPKESMILKIGWQRVCNLKKGDIEEKNEQNFNVDNLSTWAYLEKISKNKRDGVQ